jgi:triosephosphate isomerase
MRPSIIAGNWKMNTSLSEGKLLITALLSQKFPSETQVIIIPPFTHLDMAQQLLQKTALSLGAQTVSHHDNGAYTGDISANILHSMGCQYVLVGHSECRQYHKESNTLLNQKIKQALTHHLTPIYCVGETLEERQANQTLSVINTQLEVGLSDISVDDGLPLIIAYEPVWAIGTGKVATPAQAEEVHSHIRHQLAHLTSESISQHCPILYGGSVKPSNSAALLSQPNIDGGLIGGASLNENDFISIINSCIPAPYA